MIIIIRELNTNNSRRNLMIFDDQNLGSFSRNLTDINYYEQFGNLIKSVLIRLVKGLAEIKIYKNFGTELLS